RRRRIGRTARDRRADFGRLRCLVRRPQRTPRHAQLLRRRRHGGQHRQRLRGRIRGRPDQPPRTRGRGRGGVGPAMSEQRATLAVENGLVMHGRSVGAAGERAGDLVFNTSMTGYHEILTDPSYAGQAVVMTYPLIGNYGVAEEDAESAGAWPE